MKRTRRHITDEEVSQCGWPGATAFEDRAVPAVEHSKAEYLAPPPPTSALRTWGLESVLRQEAVRQSVQVEPREAHDDVEELVLDRDEYLSERVELHDALVVRGPQRRQEDGGNGEEGEMLDVGVAVTNKCRL